MSPLSRVSSFSAGDDFHLHLVPAGKALQAMALTVEQPHNLLWLKPQLLGWNRWTLRAAGRHCTVNSPPCRTSRVLCTRRPCELRRSRRFSTSGMQAHVYLEFQRQKRGTSPWQYPNRVRAFSHPLWKCLYYKKTSKNRCFICFKI